MITGSGDSIAGLGGRLREKLLRLRQELEGLAATGDGSAAVVELDQSKVGRLSRMDAMQARATPCCETSPPPSNGLIAANMVSARSVESRSIRSASRSIPQHCDVSIVRTVPRHEPSGPKCQVQGHRRVGSQAMCLVQCVVSATGAGRLNHRGVG